MGMKLPAFLTTRKTARYAGGAVVLVAVFSLGFFTHSFISKDVDDVSVREYDERYQFIRPLLICQVNEDTETSELISLKGSIEGILDKERAAGHVANASVYFRDLDSGEWTGVRELETHAPASLLKVPIMMAYFRQSRTAPSILDTRYTYASDGPGNSLVKVPLLVEGRSYSVRDLIRGMIIQSDNGAKTILENTVDKDALLETYRALGIVDPYSGTKDVYEISAKQYSLFFRVLYNGTFLGRERSNEALKILSESEYDLAIRAGTPKDVTVANKFGLRIKDEESGGQDIELSDCGIVYHAVSPYLLCVMTEGDNPYELGDVIKQIAEVAYQAVDVKKQ